MSSSLSLCLCRNNENKASQSDRDIRCDAFLLVIAVSRCNPPWGKDGE